MQTGASPWCLSVRAGRGPLCAFGGADRSALSPGAAQFSSGFGPRRDNPAHDRPG